MFHTYSQRKIAFTLAEVLITLGIIGVVVALTLPVLIEHHQKKVVVTRLKKFYTNFSQALLLSVNANGDMSEWVFPENYYDYDGSYIFFETYLKEYMQYINIKNGKNTALWPTYGVEVYLPDGSAFNLAGTWITFYPVASRRDSVTRDIFLFIIDKSQNKLYPYCINKDRTKMLNGEYYDCNCSKEVNEQLSRACSALIMYDGWEIRSDYPW